MVTGIFGLPGDGKTTYATMIAQKELKRIKRGCSRYKAVYTSFYCVGCCRLKYEDLGRYLFEDCLIIIDEITLFADSRDFKTFSKEKKEFFLLHRHYGCDIIYLTQMYDNVDKKIRDITYDLWHLKKVGLFTRCKRIFRTLEINQNTKEIVSGYEFPSFFRFLIPFNHLMVWCFRPFYYKYFDTNEVYSHLPVKPVVFWSLPLLEGNKKRQAQGAAEN